MELTDHATTEINDRVALVSQTLLARMHNNPTVLFSLESIAGDLYNDLNLVASALADLKNQGRVSILSKGSKHYIKLTDTERRSAKVVDPEVEAIAKSMRELSFRERKTDKRVRMRSTVTA